MTLAENTLHPLQIEDARDAQFKASENQRQVELDLVAAHTDRADKERIYRMALATAILRLKAERFAITACGDLARGQEAIANLRYDRDLSQGELEAVQQQAFRRGADRRAVDGLIEWSMKRDLRVDTPPAQYGAAIGGVRAA